MFDNPDAFETFQSRFWAMAVLFAVSLFASSFPTLSQRVRALRIPRIVFFLGKHFGTGVILATAFVHLLQDAFDNLGHPDVKARWPVAKWTGLIVFGSLLSIFLVEYITTSYVDRLHSYSSPSTSPTPSHQPSRMPSTTRESSTQPQMPLAQDPERAPLLTASHHHPAYTHTHTHSHSHTHQHTQDTSTVSPTIANAEAQLPPVETVAGADVIFSGGHHRHEDRAAHSGHTSGGSIRRKSIIAYPALDLDSHPDGHDLKSQTQAPGRKSRETSVRNSHCVHYHEDQDRHGNGHGGHGHGHGHGHERSSEHGHRHVHVDIESWDPDAVECSCTSSEEADPEEVRVGRKRQIVGILMLQMGIMLHSLVIGLTLSISSGAEFTSLITAIIFHQLFEGLSLGIRIAALPSSAASAARGYSILKPTLAFMFAITPPLGIALGLALFGGGRSAGAQLRLTEGLLSAVSSGMLIYAACVEMLAGDFVMDPSLWKRSIFEQGMALVSLLAGAAGMAVIG